ncbi:DedA family protein [Bradyrhizobium sp. WD16]|uniref:DedA family protein n=1 Tax=Bradyrhizobium sp. WD16 TaxID=1521768 RepID=UPI0020A330A4|nr:DedA family protein [Bradyrhizobium sp. WD16]UTD26683.1 DedA family protein [Bradyrhizobium sp. WD16]
MRTAIDSLLALVAAHPVWAYGATFLAALLEAVPVLGSFVPGSTLILGLGTMVISGGLNLATMVASAAAGAVLGDGAAFLTGHRAKGRILQTWPLSDHPEVVARSKGFFIRHGLLAVFFARFVAPVRAVVPVTAGALGMSLPRFFAVNIAAVLLWAPLHVMPGAVAGAALQRVDEAAPRHPWLIAALVIVAGLLAVSLWQHLRHHTMIRKSGTG